jgi:hypothetical protein
MQNDGRKYTVTVRGFIQSAVRDLCGEAKKSRDKFRTAAIDSLYENLREIMI